VAACTRTQACTVSYSLRFTTQRVPDRRQGGVVSLPSWGHGLRALGLWPSGRGAGRPHRWHRAGRVRAPGGAPE
jgi:hypothetical protein